jgi:serine/threonine protein kinase
LDKRKGEGRTLIWRKLHEAALGLEYLHQNDIVHGDLKCNQILVTGEGVAKLTDFGFSFVLSESKPQGSGGATRWRAPECLDYKGQMPTFESDIYSFGMCVVEAVTYDVPWGIYLPDAALMYHLRHREFIPRPEEFAIDAEWEFVLALCAFEPSKRMKLVEAIRQLERFAGDTTASGGFSLSNRVEESPSESKAALPEDAPRFEFDTAAMGSGGLPYSYVCVDRLMPGWTRDLQTIILHVLMHRLDIQSSLYPSPKNVSESDPRATRSRRAARFRRQAVARGGESVHDATVRLLLSLDASARSEVSRLLLERRFLVPFIVPASSTNASFYCDLTSLGLVATTVDHDGEDLVRANLATDTAHMRVVVLSNRPKEGSMSTDWIESVFHAQSFHALDRKNQVDLAKAETAADIGWGFLDKGNREFVPVVLLHVVGDYRPLRDFIATFADAVVLDAGSSSCDVKLQRGTLLKWTLADPDEASSIESSADDPVFVESLRCRYSTSVSLITNSLLEEFLASQGQWVRVPLDRMQASEVYMAQAPSFDFGAMEAKISFANLRFQLQLQLLFAQESREVVASQRESDPMKLATQQFTIATFQRLRQELAPDTDRHDAIMLFKRILRIKSASSRIITLLDFERWLSEQCEEEGASARNAYREARNAQAYGKILAEKLSDWDMKTTTMEHLWRELSHLYVADPVNRSNLARLAAQHLLDGFSLELMDGDAGMMNLTWIQGVLKKLHQELGSARLLVLSVMGVQSSGKSTLLNYMFGVRLRTSVSRCTRGVSIQLLKSEGRDEYEYVLLLVTEGIRAPEYIGAEDSDWRDNRMAAFAILPADATIILTKGESTTTINEILPIVLSAYLESETAQDNGGQFPSKLVFVFNQIDLEETARFENVVDTLKRELNESARKVEDIVTVLCQTMV